MAPARPIVAIGGITLDNAASAWAAGAHSVAVIGDLLAGGDPRARVASYNRLADASCEVRQEGLTDHDNAQCRMPNSESRTRNAVRLSSEFCILNSAF